MCAFRVIIIKTDIKNLAVNIHCDILLLLKWRWKITRCPHPGNVWMLTDSFLDQTQLRPLWVVFQLGLNFCISMFISALSDFRRIMLSQFSENPPSSVSDHPWYLTGFLILHHSPAAVWSPQPAVSRNLVRLALPEGFLAPELICLVRFLPTDSYSAFGYAFLLVLVFGVELRLSAALQDPIAVVPTPVRITPL